MVALSTMTTLRQLERAKRKLMLLQDEQAKALLRIILGIEADIAKATQVGLMGTFDRNRAAQILNELGRISENGLLEQRDWLTQQIPELNKAGFAIIETNLSVSGFAAENIRDTFAAWEKTNDYRQRLQAGYQSWWNEIVARDEQLRRVLQSEFTRGAALGLDGATMEKKLIESTKKLDINVADPERWANRIVRQETNRITNDIHVGFAAEIGIEKFWNFGIPDDRQGPLCAEASQQEPMTLDEWAASKYGLPPRDEDWGNCRCDLMMSIESPDFDLKELQELAYAEVAAEIGTTSGIVTDEELGQIAKTINPDDYNKEYLGLRVVAPHYDEYGLQVGEELPQSHVWIEEEAQKELLPGTSSIALKEAGKQPQGGGYSGNRVFLIGGDKMEWGEDVGEIIIKDAVILARLK